MTLQVFGHEIKVSVHFDDRIPFGGRDYFRRTAPVGVQMGGQLYFGFQEGSGPVLEAVLEDKAPFLCVLK